MVSKRAHKVALLFAAEYGEDLFFESRIVRQTSQHINCTLIKLVWLKLFKEMQDGLNALLLLFFLGRDTLKDNSLDQDISCLKVVFDQTVDQRAHLLKIDARVLHNCHEENFCEN